MDAANNNRDQESSVNRDDYLWDGSGDPDPEIQKLESALGKFRHDRPAPVLPEIVAKKHWSILPWRMRWLPALATTAAVLATVGMAIFLVRGRKPFPVAGAGWDVSTLAGTTRVGRNTITQNTSSHLGVGQVLETGAQSRARLEAADVGQIEIEPGTRLRLLTMGSALKQIALDRGTIRAYIWAPAGQFVVNTPSAVTVDLGCSYTLHVDDTGAGLVRTSLGWVGFKLNGHESFIPAGAACATRPKVGPGTPYFEDASPDFRAALSRLDFEDTTPRQRSEDLATVLAQARPSDALTLWHLLSRVDESQRTSVYDQLEKLAPPPQKVTKEGILRLDQPMLDLWWNSLGFDDIAIWRHWEHSWSGAATPVGEEK